MIDYSGDIPYVVVSLNAKNEFYSCNDIIAKYVGKDLWIWQMNYDNDTWEKAKVSETNFGYLEELNMWRGIRSIMVGFTKDDFVKQGDYWYKKEDGVTKESYYTLEKDMLTTWWIEENGEKTKSSEVILKADITLPADAEDAETVTEEEMFGYDNPYDFFQALSVAKEWTAIRYLTEEPEIMSVNSEGEFKTDDIIAKYVGKDLWIWKMKYDNVTWEKAKVSVDNSEYLIQLEELQEYWSGNEDYYAKDDFVKQGNCWYLKEEEDLDEKQAFILNQNKLTIWLIENNGEKEKYLEAILDADITLPENAEDADIVTEHEYHPYDFFQAFSVAKEYTAIDYLDDIPYVMSLNAKNEFFMSDEIIAKYVGKDLWIWQINHYNNDTWEKAKVSENNFRYVELLKEFRKNWEFLKDYNKEDFVKQGDCWYVKEDGVLNEREAFTLEKNKLTTWWIEENGEKTKGTELILKADITLPDDAKNAETITEEEMFGYDNPRDFFNAYVTAEDYTMHMYDQYGGKEERHGSVTSKGEVLWHDAGGYDFMSKYIDNQLWMFTWDRTTEEWYKAKIDPNNEKYLVIKNNVADMIKDGFEDWLTEVEFVKDGEYWYQKVNGEIERRQWFEPMGKGLMVYQEYEGKIIRDESYELRANIYVHSSQAESAKEVSAEEIFAMLM